MAPTSESDVRISRRACPGRAICQYHPEKRQIEIRISRRLRAPRFVTGGDISRQGRDIDQHPPVEGPLGRLAIQGHENDTRDQQDRDAPEQSRSRKPNRDGSVGERVHACI